MLHREHRLARPCASLHGDVRVARELREHPGLFARELDERPLLLQERRGHRHLQPHRRRDQVAQHRRPRVAWHAALLLCAAVMREDTLQRAGEVRQRMEIEDQLRRCVWRQHERVDRDVRKGQRVDDEQILATPAVDVVDQALQVVAMIERLRERIPHALAPAVLPPAPLAMPTLDVAALDLEADDRLVRMARGRSRSPRHPRRSRDRVGPSRPSGRPPSRRRVRPPGRGTSGPRRRS